MAEPHQVFWIQTSLRVEAKTISGQRRCCLQLWSLEGLNFLYKTWICAAHNCIVLFILQPSRQNLGLRSPELSPCKVPPRKQGEILHVETWVAVWDHSQIKPFTELTEVALFISLQGNGQVLGMEEGFLHLENPEGKEFPLCGKTPLQRIPLSRDISLNLQLTSWISFHIVCCLCAVTQQILLLQTPPSSFLHVQASF